jgi:hypothetical protein
MGKRAAGTPERWNERLCGGESANPCVGFGVAGRWSHAPATDGSRSHCDGLVVLGGLQRWWLQPIVSSLEPLALFFGALGLTAITDNAALTYLGSLIANITPAAQYMLMAGAVAGGGLTVIANAPNPAGVALLRRGFADESIGAGGLFLGALMPTAVAAAALVAL